MSEATSSATPARAVIPCFVPAPGTLLHATRRSLLPARMPTPQLARIPRCSARDPRNGDTSPSESNEDAHHRRRQREQDLLPFDVNVITPPGHVYLGRFQLAARTHCGDIFEHEGRQFVVKRVTMHYRYAADGRPQVFRKTIDVKSLARKALEAYLERVLAG